MTLLLVFAGGLVACAAVDLLRRKNLALAACVIGLYLAIVCVFIELHRIPYLIVPSFYA